MFITSKKFVTLFSLSLLFGVSVQVANAMRVFEDNEKASRASRQDSSHHTLDTYFTNLNNNARLLSLFIRLGGVKAVATNMPIMQKIVPLFEREIERAKSLMPSMQVDDRVYLAHIILGRHTNIYLCLTSLLNNAAFGECIRTIFGLESDHNITSAELIPAYVMFTILQATSNNVNIIEKEQLIQFNCLIRLISELILRSQYSQNKTKEAIQQDVIEYILYMLQINKDAICAEIQTSMQNIGQEIALRSANDFQNLISLFNTPVNLESNCVNKLVMQRLARPGIQIRIFQKLIKVLNTLTAQHGNKYTSVGITSTTNNNPVFIDDMNIIQKFTQNLLGRIIGHKLSTESTESLLSSLQPLEFSQEHLKETMQLVGQYLQCDTVQLNAILDLNPEVKTKIERFRARAQSITTTYTQDIETNAEQFNPANYISQKDKFIYFSVSALILTTAYMFYTLAIS